MYMGNTVRVPAVLHGTSAVGQKRWGQSPTASSELTGNELQTLAVCINASVIAVLLY